MRLCRTDRGVAIDALRGETLSRSGAQQQGDVELTTPLSSADSKTVRPATRSPTLGWAPRSNYNSGHSVNSKCQSQKPQHGAGARTHDHAAVSAWSDSSESLASTPGRLQRPTAASIEQRSGLVRCQPTYQVPGHSNWHPRRVPMRTSGHSAPRGESEHRTCPERRASRKRRA
jgi:hypothetical protein